MSGFEVITSLPQRVKSCAPGVVGFNFFSGRMSAIQLLLGEEAERIEIGKITLKTGKSIDSDTVILTTGLETSPLAASLKSDRDELGRLCVDHFLRLPADHTIFAAGDVAKVLVDDQNDSVTSCQQAIPQAKIAGQNAVNQEGVQNSVSVRLS